MATLLDQIQIGHHVVNGEIVPLMTDREGPLAKYLKLHTAECPSHEHTAIIVEDDKCTD